MIKFMDKLSKQYKMNNIKQKIRINNDKYNIINLHKYLL